MTGYTDRLVPWILPCRAGEQVLQMAEAACPASNSKALQAARLALAHERALHHGDIFAAMHLAAEMCALPDPTGATELQLRSGGLPPLCLSIYFGT